MADQDRQDGPPDELVIKLRRPVQLGTQTYAELRLREPTGAEWLEFDKLTGAEADIKAISLVSGVPEPAVRMVGLRDLRQGSQYLASFFG